MTTFERHPEWLTAHQTAAKNLAASDDDTPEYEAANSELGRVANLMANTPAVTPEELAAQFAWFKEELGYYVTENAGHDGVILETLEKGIAAQMREPGPRPTTLPELRKRYDNLYETYRAAERLHKAGDLTDGQFDDIAGELLTEKNSAFALASAVSATTERDIQAQREMLLADVEDELDPVQTKMLKAILAGSKRLKLGAEIRALTAEAAIEG